MSDCEWCDKEADDWGFNDVVLCDDCRARQLEDIEESERAYSERDEE